MGNISRLETSDWVSWVLAILSQLSQVSISSYREDITTPHHYHIRSQNKATETKYILMK